MRSPYLSHKRDQGRAGSKRRTFSPYKLADSPSAKPSKNKREKNNIFKSQIRRSLVSQFMTCRKSEAPTVRFMYVHLNYTCTCFYSHIDRNTHELRASQGKSRKRTEEIDKDAKPNLPNDERSEKIHD